jgi:menaquinone-specific isochorismate synthase
MKPANTPSQRLISVTQPIEGVTLAHFLRHGYGQARFYWEHGREEVAFAGIGTALDLVAWGDDRWEQMDARVRGVFHQALIDTPEPLAAPRLFGGFAFRDDFVPDNTWADFAPSQLVLPHYQLMRVNEQHYLTINAHLPHDEDPHEMQAALREALAAKITALKAETVALTQQAAPVDVAYPMSRDGWQTMITSATDRIQRGDLTKVVLSRVAEIRFEERVNVDTALAFLADTYTDTYRFLFEPRPHVAFYGATPELLIEVRGKQFRTMGLAGSIRRGKTDAENEALAHELLSDPKNRAEHQIVVDRIEANLEPLMHHVDVGVTGLLQLSNIQHLYTPIQGELARSSGVLPVVSQLHPTPALGGEPRRVALQMISDLEPVPRGWFGAPIGWIDHERNGQFGVAIRSAIAQEKRVWLYAGCGIVADSDPQKEWDETALKFRPMLNALGVEGSLVHG